VIPTSVSVAGADPNNFNFGVDADAKVCPFQAHIRKTNPRGDTVRVLGATEAFERSNLILRRGISYGERPDLAPGSTAPTPDAGVGLLFMCYQAGIRQFAIQQAGSDSNDFVKQDVGPDAVIGNNVQPTSQNWPKAGNASAKFTMANFVSFKGGEYFFAPSLGFLRSLSTNAA
jgi:deferrochelatase/peroxidase EfeB